MSEPPAEEMRIRALRREREALGHLRDALAREGCQHGDIATAAKILGMNGADEDQLLRGLDELIDDLEATAREWRENASIPKLFAAALSGGEDDDSTWDAIAELRVRGGDDVFSTAAGLLASADPIARARGMSVLAQIDCMVRNGPRREPAARMAEASIHDPDIRVVRSAAWALAHLDEQNTLDTLAGLARHGDAEVRHAVAVGLNGKLEFLDVLARLSRDEDDTVRDWATFGISNIEGNTPEIRALLADRLDDPCEDAAAEALWGMAKRREPSALRRVRDEIATGEPRWGDVVAAEDAMGIVERVSNEELLADVNRLLAEQNHSED